ncbi:MAG: hypothetical protein KA807_06540 [Prolixibacteraceae bacterium]|jgi:hypothetical protein|nr:hypothetical protein [Prolixibacteraceae bacterium]
MPEWKFREMQKSEVAVDPVQTQFFTTNIVGGLSSALVRESLQNSLDARLKSTDNPVFVEFRIIEVEVDEFVVGLFNGLNDHLNSRKSGINPENVPDFHSKIKVLLVEDYNTVGLPGDFMENRDPEENDLGQHNFYWFWRRVGKSGKRNEEIGRWGLGKTVFPASSKINTFWGLTVRDDDSNKFLMGSSILKIHHLDGEEVRISPYGFFGNYTDDEDPFFVLPANEAENADFIEEFERKFKIQRKSTDSGDNLVGFSVIIPFIWEEITSGDLISAVIEQFYYPILTGNLIIKIEDEIERRIIDINQDNLDQVREIIPLDTLDDPRTDEVEKKISLSKWAINQTDEDFVILNEPNINSDPMWRMEWFLDDTLRNEIKTKASNFFTGERISFKVPVKVHKRNQAAQFSYFRVFFEYDRSSNHGENYFIRDGITISSVRPLIKKGLRVLIIIEKNDLATLLGDSENPAHTEWQKDTKSLKEKYIDPDKTISFVIRSLSSLYSLIIQPKSGLDYDALQDVFFVDNEEEENVITPQIEGGKKNTSSKPKIEIEEPRSPQRYFLTKIKGGFKIVGNEDVNQIGLTLRIKVAYAITKGNPINKYSPFDFDLSTNQFVIRSEGMILNRCSLNVIEFTSITPNNFWLTVTGFDEERDLFIKIK